MQSIGDIALLDFWIILLLWMFISSYTIIYFFVKKFISVNVYMSVNTIFECRSLLSKLIFTRMFPAEAVVIKYWNGKTRKTRNWIDDMSHEPPKDLSLRILGNEEILKLLTWVFIEINLWIWARNSWIWTRNSWISTRNLRISTCNLRISTCNLRI